MLESHQYIREESKTIRKEHHRTEVLETEQKRHGCGEVLETGTFA